MNTTVVYLSNSINNLLYSYIVHSSVDTITLESDGCRKTFNVNDVDLYIKYRVDIINYLRNKYPEDTI